MSYVLAVSGVEHDVKVDPAAGYAFMNYHDPGDHGHWLTVCERHRRWSLDGDWAKILSQMRDGCDEAEGKDWSISAVPIRPGADTVMQQQAAPHALSAG